jgi:hypothetical protein
MRGLKRKIRAYLIKRKEARTHRRYEKVLDSKRHLIKKELPPEVSAQAVSEVWAPYAKVDPGWAQVYCSINGIASPYYIPSDLWFVLIRRMRAESHAHRDQQDKNYLDTLFGGSVRMPVAVARRVSGTMLDGGFHLISFDDALERCMQYDELVVKPSTETHGGENVCFITRTGSDAEFREELSSAMKRMGRDFIVQLPLRQHPDLAALNPDSVNTLRMLTLLWNGEVRLIGALVRVGVKGIRVDNPHSSNGVSCVIDENGCLTETAYDRDWNGHKELPCGIVCKGYRIPHYEDVKKKVFELHARIPYAKIVGWDMTVSEDGVPTMIEANIGAPEIYFHQIAAGPMFKDPELFNEIFSAYYGRKA